jgi:endoglycosylceramidase
VDHRRPRARCVHPRRERGSNVLRPKLARLDRPHPQAVAGTPTSFGYDRDANTFSLKYSAKSPGGERQPRSRRTRVYVPRRHYPEGYDVNVSGARVVSEPDSKYLLLKRRPGAESVRLELSGAS